eukprot:305114-Karenia_brevis.AAC.1
MRAAPSSSSPFLLVPAASALRAPALLGSSSSLDAELPDLSARSPPLSPVPSSSSSSEASSSDGSDPSVEEEF